MNQLYDLNLESLRLYNNLIFDKIDSVDSSAYTSVESKLGDRVPQVTVGNKKLFIHSRFDPVKEAERQLSEILQKDFDLYIVFGFGYAYHIELLLKDIPENSNILVIQKDLSLVKSALENRNLKSILEDSRLRLLINPTEDDLAISLKGKSSHRVTMVTHRGSFQVDPEYYQNVMRLAKSYLSTKDVNIATLSKFEKTWSANIARNIKSFISTPGVDIFYDRFKGHSAIVVAAGPSLNRTIPFLKENQHKFVIVAVDTAYLLLQKHGIEPHFCLSVDPQVINARYFEGARESRTILVSDPTVHPSVHSLFKGKRVVTGMAFEMMKWIENISGAKGEITHGGSVSTNCYDFARRLGVDRVYLVGQDLSFTHGLAHARGSYLDEQIHNRVNRFKNAQMFNRGQLTALPKIFIKGINGNRVHTNQKMMIFLNWFGKLNDSNLTNLTIDGAFIENVNHDRLENIEIPTDSDSIQPLINNIVDQAAADYSTERVSPLLDKMREKVKTTKSDLNVLSEKLTRAVKLSEDLCEIMKKEKRDSNKTAYIIKKLGDIDSHIESISTAKDVIGLTAQRVIHTITEGYDMDEQSDNNDLEVAKKSLYLYKGLLEGAAFNMKSFNRMEKILKG